ncbi:MAG: thioredoxin family protein, partial [Holdemanella sp.]|nr:thioredoxin family protein [Holdemanella sp.]
VQNWNDGKSQEFKDRKVYDIANSHLSRKTVEAQPVVEECACEHTESSAQVFLFATKTCPNCKQAEKLLNEAGVAYTKILAEENPDMATKFGIRQAPTLVLDGDNPAKLVGLGGVRKFLAETVKH